MKENKKTKKALIGSILTMIVCVGLLVGSTFAWFTDSVTSKGNIIKSGNLDVTMEWADGTEAVESAEWIDASQGAIFNNDKWEPGYTEAKHIKIENKGNLAFKYEVRIVPTGEVEGLADVIDVYYVKGGKQIENRTGLTDAEKIGTLSSLLKEDNIAKGHVSADEADIATIALKMQETAGNEYQGMKIGDNFTIQLVATQYAEEEDSFGKDYDENATLPWDGVSQEEVIPNNEGNYDIASAANLAWLSEEINNGTTNFSNKTIELTDDIDLNNHAWDSILFDGNDSGVTIDGNGHVIRNLRAEHVADGSNGLKAGYGGGFIAEAKGKITIKDLTFDHVTVAPKNPNSLNTASCNIVGIVMGYTYGETLFDNVKVTNSTVEGFGKIGVMVGMGAEPGVKITFRNCVSKGNVIKATYNAGGLAGNIQRKNGVDHTVIENCIVEDNEFVAGGSQYIDLLDQKAIFKSDDTSSGTDVQKSLSGKYWNDGTYYWGAYGKYYVSYGNQSHDAPIITEGQHMNKKVANSEICVNEIN